jgi:serine phosphatase RsbU (regulator of sigma subunit)
MGNPRARFSQAYQAAFRDYLTDQSEQLLQAAYELGREAVGEGLGVLDIAAIHHEALATALRQTGDRQPPQILQAGGDFFREGLAAFEMVQRSFRDAEETARLYARERLIAETLQRGLLPEHLPEIHRVSVAARYLPGAMGVNVGGDWYDVISLLDGRAGIALGDVAGRGIKAASVMGQVRTAFHAYALRGDSPATVVRRLDQLIQTLDGDHFSTLTYVILDPASGRTELTRAGHPPPLVKSPDGDVSFLLAGLSMPLGVETGSGHCETAFDLKPGSVLMLFSDGLIEGKPGGIDHSLSVLEQVVADGPSELEALCDHVLLEMPSPEASDDIALLLARWE